jgi:hypothetical protein
LSDVTKVNHPKPVGLQQILYNLFALNKSPDVLKPEAVPIYEHQIAMAAVSRALT